MEIYGESYRGLCNGIYSFLSALGLSWPQPGEEILPPRPDNSPAFPLSKKSAYEPSHYEGNDMAEAPLRRFIPAPGKTVNKLNKYIKKPEAFAAWAARQRYDALVFPLALYASSANKKIQILKAHAADYGINLEAGGRELSSLLPRKYFFLHRDLFRLEDGRRKMKYLFCPTNPAAVRIVRERAKKLFRSAAEINLFHLWPERGAEKAWCSCPSCRAFSQAELNRIAVNAAADGLAEINPRGKLSFFEESGQEGNVPLRKNLHKLESLPGETIL